jgi:hypothetical protein
LPEGYYLSKNEEHDMTAYDAEKSIAEGQGFFESLIQFVRGEATHLEAHEIERGIFERILPIGLAAMKLYFAEKGTGDHGENLIHDDQFYRRQPGFRDRRYASIFGPLDIARTCYRRLGEEGIYPLDHEANLPDRQYSYFLQELMNLFSIDHPFSDGAKRLKLFLGQNWAASVLIDVAHDGATDYDEYYEQKEAPEEKDEGEIQVASFDGKGVPILKAEAAKIQAKLGKGEKKQKKKEALVGSSYTVDRNVRSAEEMAIRLVYPEQLEKEKKESPKGQNIRRMASVKRSKEEVMSEIKKDVEKRDPTRKRPLVILQDGAAILWSLATNLFGAWDNIWFILDIIHVRHYLWDAANALYGEKSEEGKAWVKEKLEQILKGGVGYVVGAMKQIISKRNLKGTKRKALEKAITYFEKHKQWMKYDEYLAEGFPVATGVVESACGSVVQDRMEGSGKRWSIDGAESVLILRSLEKSDDYTEYWNYHISQEKNRLYQLYEKLKFNKNKELEEAA